MGFETRLTSLTLCVLYALGMLVAMGIPAASAQTRPVDAPSSRTDGRSDWGRVQHLASGAAIIIAIGEAPPGPRIVIAASDTDLALLDIAEEQLDASLRRALRRIATEQPDYFARAASGQTVVFNDVRLTRRDVFEKNRRVTSLDTIVSTVPRDDIREVVTRRRGRGFWGHLGPLGGYFLGGMGAGLATAAACHCDGGFLVGMVGGGVAGGAYGWHAAHRQTDDVIYRRPPADD